ncbi:hypothetical protein SDC9_114204 [bioreactor metagenome]|uniref:Uncharacterized protein n=1 Tax=bioreactor metagenome TaxID=1076179 RepID=A0A645BPZ6_9ZZZZ
MLRNERGALRQGGALGSEQCGRHLVIGRNVGGRDSAGRQQQRRQNAGTVLSGRAEKDDTTLIKRLYDGRDGGRDVVLGLLRHRDIKELPLAFFVGVAWGKLSL